VRFLKPVESLVFKYSLSTKAFQSEQGIVYAHLFVMPGVTKELIHRLIDDLRTPRAFDEPAKQARSAAVSARAVSERTDVSEVSAPVPATAVPLVGRGFQ
jgi:histidine decarboxylase